VYASEYLIFTLRNDTFLEMKGDKKMNQPSLILLVKFKSLLSFEEVIKVVDSRIDEFKALKGLQQKYYLQEPSTQEYAGLYLWESKEDFLAYRDSELRATIAKAYQAEGEPRIEVFNVVKPLRE
jgi:heme-degrading monooxygenase HmoA